MSQKPGETPTAASVDASDELSTGTTVLALTGVDGVVLGADARVSLSGRFVTNMSAQKVESIGDRAAVAFSGGVSDAQALVGRLRVERRLYELEHDRPMATDALAQRAAGLIRTGRFRSIGLLLGGVSDDPAVYWIDGAGGVMRDAFAANGSGMQLAYGALERSYEPGRPVEELRPLAASALEAAAERDVASGDGMTITTVTDEGLNEIRTDGLGVASLDAAADPETGPSVSGDEEVV